MKAMCCRVLKMDFTNGLQLTGIPRSRITYATSQGKSSQPVRPFSYRLLEGIWMPRK